MSKHRTRRTWLLFSLLLLLISIGNAAIGAIRAAEYQRSFALATEAADGPISPKQQGENERELQRIQASIHFYSLMNRAGKAGILLGMLALIATLVLAPGWRHGQDNR